MIVLILRTCSRAIWSWGHILCIIKTNQCLWKPLLLLHHISATNTALEDTNKHSSRRHTWCSRRSI